MKHYSFLMEANINNYHIQTIGTFKYLFGGPLKLIGKKLRRLGYRLKYTSPSNLTGKTGSVYYISRDGTKLVRISDHWSSSNVGGVNTCGNIKDCFWRLRGKPGQVTNTEYQAGIIDLVKLKEVRPIRNPPQTYTKGDGNRGTGYLRTTIWDQGPQEFERRRFRSVLTPRNPAPHNTEYIPPSKPEISIKERLAAIKAKKRSESAYRDVLTIQEKLRELEKQLPFQAPPTPEILALRKQQSIAQLRANGLSEEKIATRRLSSAETRRQSIKDAIKRAREEALKRQQK